MIRIGVQVIVTLRGEVGSFGTEKTTDVFGSGTDCHATTLLPVGAGSPLTSMPMLYWPAVTSLAFWPLGWLAKNASANFVPVESFASAPIGGSSWWLK